MKRLVLVAALAALLLPAGNAHAASVYSFRFFSTYYSSGPNSVGVTAYVTEDLTGNNPPYAFAYATITTAMGSDTGSGVLDVILDPASTVGQVTGSLPGAVGPITVDLTFLGLSVNSSQPPSVYAQVNPTGQQFYAGAFFIKSGSSDGTVTSGVGPVSVVGGQAWANTGLSATSF